MDRRSFLKSSLLASAGTLLMPRLLYGFGSQPFAGRRLIVVQLSGGNDGLNTLVPFGDDRYYAARPTIGLRPDQLLKATDHMGFHPSLQAVKALYDQGEMAIINQVGYPEPDRSHFRSMDIWQSGSSSRDYWHTGWLGRYGAQHFADAPEKPMLVEVDAQLSMALKADGYGGMALSSPQRLIQVTRDAEIAAFGQLAGHHHEHEAVSYLYRTLGNTLQSAEYLQQQLGSRRQAPTGFPDQPFGQQCRTVAHLIEAGAETQVYYLSLSGFDTHVQQLGQQARVLTQLSEGVSALASHLRGIGEWDRTLVLVFSEFGRRVAQNASGGTDHGAANNLWMLGGKLRRQGFLNTAPDLSALDDGDLRYQVDFREVYATILDRWLQADHQQVLGERFALGDYL